MNMKTYGWGGGAWNAAAAAAAAAAAWCSHAAAIAADAAADTGDPCPWWGWKCEGTGGWGCGWKAAWKAEWGWWGGGGSREKLSWWYATSFSGISGTVADNTLLPFIQTTFHPFQSRQHLIYNPHSNLSADLPRPNVRPQIQGVHSTPAFNNCLHPPFNQIQL